MRLMRTPTTEDPSRRRRVWIVLSALAGIVVLLAVAALRLLNVADTLREANAEIQSAVDDLKDGRIAEAVESVSAASVNIENANTDLRTSPELQILGALPGIRQNLEAIEESVEVAAAMAHGGRRILDDAAALQGDDGTLQVSLSAGSVPVEDIASARMEIEALQAVLPDRVPKNSPLLTASVRDLRERVFEEAVSRRAELDRLDHGLTLLTELAGVDRPRRYLIAVSNTAEMRGTGGMMLNYGVLNGVDGVIDLTDFGRVEELLIAVPVAPGDVGLADDYLRRWDGFDVTREWRNATMGGDFTVVAPVLQGMYRRATGLPVDGVIQIDPSGLAALLEGVGPVEVPEVGLVDAGNVEALVLNEAYRLFPGVEARSDVLGDVAEAAFRRLVEGEFDSVRDLAESIVGATDGRHLMMHSSTSAAQAAVVFFGADGSLPDPEKVDAAHLTVQNLSGNKLDYYLDTALAITGQRPEGEIGSWTVDITILNTAPPGATTPRYIFGPYDDSLAAGTYRGAVSLYLPAGTELAGFSDAPYRLPPSLQTENGRPVVGFWVDLAAGESRSVTLELTLPPRPAGSDYDLELVPSARVRPTMASVDIELEDGTSLSETVALDRTWILAEGHAAQPSTGG